MLKISENYHLHCFVGTTKKHVAPKVAAKRGRPKQGEERVKLLTRTDKQADGMSLTDMLNDLPKSCDVGTKKNSKGYKIS